MKKYVSLLLALLMICSLCACGNDNEPAPTKEPESNVKIDILLEQDDSMKNTYSLLAVDPAAPFADADGNPVSDVKINTVGADALINWLLSKETMELAANYGNDTYGECLFYALDGAPVSEAAIPQAEDETTTIRVSTTTSVNDSGLLGYLLPKFEEAYGYGVEVFSMRHRQGDSKRQDGQRRPHPCPRQGSGGGFR